MPQGVNGFEPRTIIVKTKNGLDPALNRKGAGTSKKAIPHLSKKTEKHPLATIYRVTIDHDDVIGEINKLLADSNIIYAEPLFYHQSLFVPNDPEANPATGGQNYLEIIKAFDAWTIEKGDSTVVIGILDSGVDSNHPELLEQVAYNYNDPINGIDDDGDGLVDNFAGWDIADNDNNAIADNDPHGTQVAGISSARVNNGEGMAGVGFRSKYLPIKIFTSENNRFSNGYEGIALAADLGCDVLNLSWGSPNSFSQFGQDVINYAVLEKDVVIVAAAGNTDAQLDFYPASFDNVISVSATDVLDQKTFFATYSYHVDMVAPGIDIYSTNNNGSYISGTQGTSFSSPMVAGAAAMLRAKFPNLSAPQIMEKLRVTSDDIYDVGSNSSYEGLLGKGRLNMLEALTNNSTPALRMIQMEYTNGINASAYRDDTLSIEIKIVNYLSSTFDANAIISSNSPYVSILQNEFSLGEIMEMDTITNQNSIFQVVLSEDLPPDEVLEFRIDFSDGFYEDFQYFTITSSANYADINSGKLTMTISGDGDLAYDDPYFDSGIGVEFDNQQVLDNLGVMISFNEEMVADNITDTLSLGTKDDDFTINRFQKQFNNGAAPIDFRSQFNISDSVLIDQKTLANDNDSFIIQEYRLTNLSDANIQDFNLAFYADWNIGVNTANRASWHGESNLGYIHDGQTYLGIALITQQDSIYAALNNLNLNGNSADIPGILTDSIKFHLSSQGIFKEEAGEINDGNDVSHVLGAHIDQLNVLGSENVAFVFVGGSSLQELIDLVNLARVTYENYRANPPVIHITETCIGETATINPTTGINFDFYSDVALTDLIGSGEELVTASLTSPATYYVVNKDQPFNSDIFSVIAKPKAVSANFESDPPVLLLDETGTSVVQFTDQSIDAVSWSWNFDNGFTSNVRNPIMNFPETGTYSISLIATSDIGCEETINQSLVVANRSQLPDINNVEACSGEEIVLTASNATNLTFYSDETLTNQIFTGSSFTSTFNTDTTLYVVSTDSLYQSNVKVIDIDIDDVKAALTYTPDTLDTSSNTLIAFESSATNNELNIWYINDQLVSSQSSFTYDYSNDSSLEIRLVAESINSCQDVLALEITPEMSQNLNSENLNICKGKSVTINPEGTFLHFYADETLTQLIAKGSNVHLESIKTDTSIFVTNNEGLIESTAAEYFVNVSDVSAQILPEITKLNLTETNDVQFYDTGIGATEWFWTVDGDTVSNDQNPILSFTGIGQYHIRLNAMDEIGCKAYDSLNYEVVNITSLDKVNDWLIYPNPTNGLLYFSETVSDVNIYNSSGVLVKTKIDMSKHVDISELPTGVFLVRGHIRTEAFAIRVFKE